MRARSNRFCASSWGKVLLQRRSLKTEVKLQISGVNDGTSLGYRGILVYDREQRVAPDPTCVDDLPADLNYHTMPSSGKLWITINSHLKLVRGKRVKPDVHRLRLVLSELHDHGLNVVLGGSGLLHALGLMAVVNDWDLTTCSQGSGSKRSEGVPRCGEEKCISAFLQRLRSGSS